MFMKIRGIPCDFFVIYRPTVYLLINDSRINQKNLPLPFHFVSFLLNSSSIVNIYYKISLSIIMIFKKYYLRFISFSMWGYTTYAPEGSEEMRASVIYIYVEIVGGQYIVPFDIGSNKVSIQYIIAIFDCDTQLRWRRIITCGQVFMARAYSSKQRGPSSFLLCHCYE